MKQKTNITSLHSKDTAHKKNDRSEVSSLSPREIVSELDRYVIGQQAAKRAVAIALRNRWRRQALNGEMKNEFSGTIENQKINQVKVPISLENLRDAAKLLPKAMLLKYPVINVTIVNNTGLTEMELG